MPQILLIVFTSLTAYLKGLPKNRALLMVGFVLTTPLFVFRFPDGRYFAWWLIALLLWLVASNSRLRAVAITARFVLLVVTPILILHNNGLVNDQMKLDRERIYFVNNKFDNKIISFQQQATYLPYRLRDKVFGPWVMGVNMGGRTLRYLSPDILTSVLGLGLTLLVLVGIASRTVWWEMVVTVVGVAAMALARDPNTLTYFWLWPALILMALAGIRKINQKWLLLLLIINFIYRLTP